MEIERVLTADGRIELWSYDWDMSRPPARRVNRTLIGLDRPRPTASDSAVAAEAICWSYGRTLGNITVSSEELIGRFPAQEGDDAALDCEIVAAGKMRNGKDRWWCRTHQAHWGTLADIADASAHGSMRCSNHAQPMSYVVSPHHIVIQDHGEVGVWCSLPPALTHEGPGQMRRPKIHVHVRDVPDGPKVVDQDFKALSLVYDAAGNKLFGSLEISKVHLTPPSALEFVLALETGRAMRCINCNKCGYPHLDLGDFARTPHRKHLCGNCGSDSTWSKVPVASTPLKPLHDQYSRANEYDDVERELNLDDFAGLPFQVWASTPAVLWTAERRQERGIHVHVYGADGYAVDDTFGTVVHRGRSLDRNELLKTMVGLTLT